jgi:Prokaryotic RING finger family 4
VDPIATLILSRTNTVVLDVDWIANAATRPARDGDVERFEATLLGLGFVLSLDLAMALRRLPHEALASLQRWIVETLATGSEGARPASVLPWLHAPQPCPWCGQTKAVSALDPCGHLVCAECWRGGSFAGCPICHRRATPMEVPAALARREGTLRLLHLAVDAEAVARARFERLVASELTAEERVDLELVIDAIGPKAVQWLPKQIAVRETMAIAIARLWTVAPDREAMMHLTYAHVQSPVDVLRIAIVLMRGNASLAEPMRLASIPRSMRRAVLAALEQQPRDVLIEAMRRQRGLWKRVGERLHPGESKLPGVKHAFDALRNKPVEISWGGRVEAALAARDARAAAALLGERPAELLRRAAHVVRVAQPDAVAEVHAALRVAAMHGEPAAVLALATQAPVALMAIAREALVARAETGRNFARAVIDRSLPAALWNAAAIVAAVRANTIYVRERDAHVAIFKRRDGESNLARLARVHAGEHDGVARIPPATAPTWFALVRDDIALPRGSEGFVLDAAATSSDGITRLSAADVVAGLA